MKRLITLLLLIATSLPLLAQTRYWGDLYSCNDYNSFSLRLINFNNSGEKHFIANDSKMEISFVHNGEKTTVPSKGESKAFNGKATSIFDNCSIYLGGFPLENYNQYILLYNETSGKINQLVNSEDFVSKMYGMPDTRNPENLASGIKLAQKLMHQFEDINKEIQSKLNARDVSRNFDDANRLAQLSNSCAINIGICKRVIGDNQTSIDNIKKEAEVKIQQETVSKSNESKSTGDNDFWSDNGNRSSGNTTSSSANRQSTREDVVSDSDFKGNLRHVKEGDYFKDDKGQHYQRTARGATKVDRYTYERAQANRITADFERREAERAHMEAVTTHAINTTFTSFYAMRAAGQNLKDATELGGYFENIEDLNRAFAQKLNEVSQMSEELKAVSVNSVQNYAQAVSAANSTATADYTAYGQALGAIGGIAAGIKADKAAKEAREELRAQREAHERNIKARQLQALLNIRGEIDQMFPEGGMPLSSHKIDAPVLYLFAYTSNKNEWKEDKTVAMTVSNVIPVYRYSDGTYPYIANVKRTFETGGMSNPVVVGYFTDQAMAEKYQQSLLGVADQGQFFVSHVDIKVTKKDADKPASAETDFWGNQVKPDANSKKKPVTKKKEDDFWNN